MYINHTYTTIYKHIHIATPYYPPLPLPLSLPLFHYHYYL